MASCMKQLVATLCHIRPLSAGADPKVWLIPSLAWRTQTAPSSSKDFKGGRSKPEWGLSVAKKHWPILDEFRFERSLPRLFSKMGRV